ncbi:MAG: rod shape-determining protein MreD [Acidimicrobiales bacterium]
MRLRPPDPALALVVGCVGGLGVLSGVRVFLVIFFAIVLQTSVVAGLPLAGARGDIVLLVAISAGFESDAERGAVVGFAAGLVFDLLLNSPAGLSALTYCVVGYVVGRFNSSVLRSTWWIPVVGTMVASAFGVLLFAAMDEILGQATVDAARLPTIVAVVASVNGVLSRPMRWVMRRALAPSTRSRDHFSMR